MSIPERFMVTGKRIDNGKRVKGYYFKYKADTMFTPNPLPDGNFPIVDPETIEPVAVKVIVETEDETGYPYEYVHYRCPNCKNVVKQARKSEKNTSNALATWKYCWDCGQRLDWSE